ncbi:MAG: AsmA family protein [Thiotrichaceae bacterium]
MKTFKVLSIIVSLILILIIGGLVFFVTTFDANHYKQKIISLVNKKTGRELTIAGDLKLAVYPDIAIEMGNTSLSNAKGFAGDQFATIGSAQVSVEVLPLLKKEIKIDEVRLNGLKLNLHRKADGSTNWDDLAQDKGKDKSTTKDKPPAKVVQEMLDNLSVAGVSLKDADIHWRDDQSGQDIRIAPLNLKTGTFKPGSPLPVDLSLVMKQKNPATTIAAEGTTTVTLSADNQHFSLDNLKLHSKITGAQIPNGALDANIRGNITGSPAKISIPNLKLLATLNGDLIPEGEVVADITGNVDFDLNAQLATIANLTLDAKVNGKPLEGGNLHALVTGDTTFNMAGQKLSIPNLGIDANLSGGFIKGGAATAKINGNTQFDLTKQLLTISGLKLDATANGELLQGGKAHSKIAGDLSVDLAKSHIKMPQISMNTLVEGGPVPGGKLSQQGQGSVDMNWANQQGGINLSSLLVKLANLELTGSQVQLQPLADKPAITGQFKTNTFNLKQVLKTLGIESPVTSNPQALSQVQAQFSLKADTENADLPTLKIKLDKSTITGKLGIKNFTSPSIYPELKIDSINVDDYLAATSGTTKAPSTAQAQTSSNQEIFPLETLRSLNIDGGINIGSMIINKLSLSQINTRIKAKQGLVIVDPANASLYKGKYKGRITLDAKQATPTMKMRHELVGLRSEGLLFDLFQDKYMSGDTKLVTELSSRGNTMDVLLRNLNGTTSIGFKDGTIRDSSFAEKVSLAVKVFEKKAVEGDKSIVTFTGLSGDWKTTNGVFKTDNLSMLSPYFNISGTGTADVAKQVLDMKLRIGPNSDVKGKKIFAPLHIYGSFSDPKFKLDLKDLIKALAQADLDKIKQDAKEKLDQAKLEAKQKLDLEKKKLQNRLADEKAAKEQQLRKKAEDAKAKALKKVEEKVGSQVTDKLKEQLGDDASLSGDASKEKIKDVEDKLKDKLKSGLKGLF